MPKFGGRLTTMSESGIGIRLGVFVPYDTIRQSGLIYMQQRRVRSHNAYEKKSRYKYDWHTHYVYGNIDL